MIGWCGVDYELVQIMGSLKPIEGETPAATLARAVEMRKELRKQAELDRVEHEKLKKEDEDRRYLNELREHDNKFRTLIKAELAKPPQELPKNTALCQMRAFELMQMYAASRFISHNTDTWETVELRDRAMRACYEAVCLSEPELRGKSKKR